MNDEDLEQNDEKKLWIIVRYNVATTTDNQFKVRGGEIFKIGRVKFRVREVVIEQNNNDDENKTDFQSFVASQPPTHNNNEDLN